MELKLPSRLDYQSLPTLIEGLKTAGDDPLVLNASELRHLGTLPLQALLSAVKTRAAAGLETSFSNANDACIDMLSLFGFTPETFTQPEAWT